RSMGAEIEGDGTEVIRIQGKTSLNGANHEVIGDRIEAGTFLAATMATGGQVLVRGIQPVFLDSVLDKMAAAGAEITREANAIGIKMNGRPQGIDFSTSPFPGFPTDMQAQLMAALTVAEGPSLITETIFENRFMHVPELTRLGADLTIRGNTVMVRGKNELVGAPLMATDLRASASLVIGGLVARGETQVSRIYHLDRGYEKMEAKLKSLGAQIERVAGEE
ncbi:MAG: UDP-N-acetylglucosamine 1-carboxyvinyltransferase, partial [Proteobacteria bacterium]